MLLYSHTFTHRGTEMPTPITFWGLTADIESVLNREETVELSVSDTRTNLSEVLDNAHYKNMRFVLTKHEQPYAGIVSAEDLLRLEIFDQIINRQMMLEQDADPSFREGSIGLDALIAEYSPMKKEA